MKFINPVPYGNIDNFLSSSKVMVMNSYPNQKIVAPFNGLINNVDLSEKSIEIEHNVNGSKVYSKINGIVNPYVNKGYKVSQNDIIGFVGDEPIKYSITDRMGFKQNLDSFFKDLTNKKQTGDDEKKQKEVDSKEKENKEKEKLSIDLGLSKDEQLPGLYRGMMNLFAAPFSVVGSALKGNLIKRKKSEEKEEKINEDIQRIKKLIKF